MADMALATRLFAALAIVLVATTLCGRLAMLVRQPRVVGEMVAGVLLGPSLLGLIAPTLQASLFPKDVRSVLYVLSTIGLTFYMFLVGASLDHRHTGRTEMRKASVVAVCGVVPVFLLGAGAGAVFAGQLAAPGISRWELMLFLGGALSITAFPMLARILQEREIANTPIGGLTLLAAAIDDAAAWGLLAVIVAVATAGDAGHALPTIVGAALFALAALTVGRKLLAGIGELVERHGRVRRDVLATILLVVLAAGWLTDEIGVFSVFGGFVTGLAMPRSPTLLRELEAKLTDVNSVLLLPVFFAFSGLNTDLTAMSAGGGLVLPAVAIAVVATVGKYGGCGLAILLQGYPLRYASAVGGLMNARGLMILIFINIGLSYHLITPALFSILVVVAIVTTGAAMPIYRASVLPAMETTERLHGPVTGRAKPQPRGLETALQHVTYVIVGAGPAGLQLAHFLDRAGHEFVVLEAGAAAGGFFDRFPRHRTLLSINKRFNMFQEEDFNLRHDWNSLLSDVPGLKFGDYSDALYPDASDLARYLRDFAGTLGDRIRYEARVERVTAGPGGTFDVHLRSGAGYRCDRLIMATGAVAPHIPDDIDGIEHAVGYEEHSLDPAEYEGKTVGIIGSGNSAFEVANHLAGHAAMVHLLVRSRIRHAWETHFPGDLRSINNTILDMYQLKSMHATLGDRLESIVPNPNGGFDTVVAVDVPHWDPPGTFKVPRHYDKVIRCTGWRYLDLDMFAPECRPQADPSGRYPLLSSTWESTVPGLYFIGTVMQARGREAANPFIHGFRYNIRSLFHLLQERYHNVPLPHQKFPAGTPADLAELAVAIIKRVSRAASIFQQFGVLVDAVVLDGEEARLYPAVPRDHLFEHATFAGATMVVVTLEYGFDKYPRTSSTLDFLTPKDPKRTECAAFLHPVFRLYRRAELVSEVHFGESLLIRYDLDGQIGADDPQAGRLTALLAMAQGRTESLPDPPMYLPVRNFTFTPWNEQERRAWQPAVAAPEPDAECHYGR